jgi:ABC-type multidrug transport system ATPase subunit
MQAVLPTIEAKPLLPQHTQGLSGKLRNDSILTWKNVNYEVDVYKKAGLFKKTKSTLKVLSDVSGYAKSGECLAIIGGSGAGKSSLLNILADKFEKGKHARFSGDVKLNNAVMNYEKFKQIIGFVMQADIFMEFLKVNEYLKFAIDLRYGDLTEGQKRDKLEKVIKKLKLEKAQNNLVGGQFQKGISGGEKKRLNIGFELLADPSVIFLDEPTSGLDSYTSFLIVGLLQKIARENNVIVIYTIHQPSMDIFKLFDNLLVMDKGRPVYFGQANRAAEYYGSMGYPCPLEVTPPNHIIEVALKGGDEINKQFSDHYLTDTVPEVDMIIENSRYEPVDRKVFKAGGWTQFKILMSRAVKNFFRNPLTFHVRIAQVVYLCLIFCCLFFQLSDDFSDPKNVFNRQGAFFFFAINTFINYFMSYVLVCRLISPIRKRSLLQRI